MTHPRLNSSTCRVLLAALLALAGAPAPAQEQDPPARALFLSMEGEIDGLTERTLELQLRHALQSPHPPRFVVVEIDSPGGELNASRNLAWNLLELQGVTTVAWVRGQALSGATIVAFGCDLIAISGRGQLGDAMPIQLDQFRLLQPQVAEKMISHVRKDLRYLAERQGYPGDAAEAMVDPTLELWRLEVRDEVTGRLRPRWVSDETLQSMSRAELGRVETRALVCPADQLLVLGRDDALDMGVARLAADDRAGLCAALAKEFSLAAVEPDVGGGLWWEQVVRFLTWWPVKTLLFVVGLVALAVALGAPGQLLPEVVAALCLGTVFFGSYLIGLADYVELLLFLGGVVLLGIELVTPGFGLPGISGGVLVLASFVLTFQSFVWPSDPLQWEAFQANLGKALLGCAGSALGLVAVGRYLPHAGPFARLVHRGGQAAAPPATPLEVLSRDAAPVGALGVASTVLRPVGRVRVGEQTFDAVVDAGFAPEGAPVVVVGHRGAELLVELRPEASPAGGAGASA